MSNTYKNDSMWDSFKIMELQIHAVNVAEKWEIPMDYVTDFNSYFVEKTLKGWDEDKIVKYYMRKLFLMELFK